MTKNFYAFIFGLLFGLGLIIAQMTNPEKVLAFLDVAGDWDPSLAVVMASALLVLGLSRLWFRRSGLLKPEVEQQIYQTIPTGIDKKLIIGATIFGLGWGLAGICPGPAIVDLSSGLEGSFVFIGAMFAGFLLFNLLQKKR